MSDQHRMLTDAHKGWRRVWELIFIRFGCYSCRDPGTGEAWQYMGTTNDTHFFRHRSLPGNAALQGGMPEKGGTRVDIRLTVVPDDFEEVPKPLPPLRGQVFDFHTYNTRLPGKP